MTTFADFDAACWQRVQQDHRAWWDGTLDRGLVVVETFDTSRSTFMSQFPLNVPVAQVIDFYQGWLDSCQYFGDAYPKLWLNFGAGVMAAFLGSQLEFTASTDTTWFYPLGVESLSDLHPAYDPDNPWWRRVQDIGRAAVQRFGDRVIIGQTDIGGNLDILASLRGTEKLLIDVIDAPEEVERLTQELTALWLRYYDELQSIIFSEALGGACWSPVWFPGRGYMLQSDFSYMISPRMFKRFVLPDLIACTEAMDYGFYHMDGKGQIPHLDMLLSIPRLRGIQWQPGAGAPMAEGWIDLLERIRDGGKLCQVYVHRQGALEIARQIGGRGILFYVEEPYLTTEQAETFMEQMARIQ